MTEDNWFKNQKKDRVTRSREKLSQRVGKARADELLKRIAEATMPKMREEKREKEEDV